MTDVVSVEMASDIFAAVRESTVPLKQLWYMAQFPYDALLDAAALPDVAAVLSDLSCLTLDIQYCTDLTLFKYFVNLEELKLFAFDKYWIWSLSEEKHDANEKKIFNACFESCIRLRKVSFAYPRGHKRPRYRTYTRVSEYWEAYEEHDERFMPPIHIP
jgi:hypothetical protein